MRTLAQRLRRRAARQARKARIALSWSRPSCPCGACGPSMDVQYAHARLAGYHAGRAVALRLAAIDAEAGS